ncbi:hypothetical protein ETECTG_CDS0178 [Escherichia phage ETEC-TG]|nr:hypothetical protein ETECTG_CDS0178 [Escherichia phage ETEC-TG]
MPFARILTNHCTPPFLLRCSVLYFIPIYRSSIIYNNLLFYF